MSAETLREAARLMRERAVAATFVYASHHPKTGQVVPWFDAADAYSFDESDGPHILGWSPAVALAVAEWLDRAGADLWAHGLASEACLTCGGCDDCDDLIYAPHVRAALAVARAYLGEQP